MPPGAAGIEAPSSTCAFWELESLMTTTWAPSATSPTSPANASPFVVSSVVAPMPT